MVLLNLQFANDEDEAEGTVFLIDTGAAHSPRYFVPRASVPGNQFFAWVLINPATGALWTGAFPTFTEWSGLTAPAITSPVPGLFVSVPSPADRLSDAFGRVVAPVRSVG